MSEYISRVAVEVSGQVIDDFESFEEGEYRVSTPVKLMNSTGHALVTPRPTCSLEYVLPATGVEFDFTQVVDGTITVDYLNGTRKTYTGATTEKIGPRKFDGEKGATKKIEFSASKIVEE
jgi:hypothetical protein